jgi:Flp pilus assembly protein TadG
VPYKEQRGSRRRRMLVVFAVVAIGGAAGVGIRLAAAAEDPAATAATVQTSTEPVHVKPTNEDFVRIQDATAVAPAPRAGRNASRGTFTSQCGRNADGSHRNSDNFITSPGVTNAAHHTHDYVGNTSTDGNATDASLAAAGTTCRFGDKSTYFWPVIRDITTEGADADQPGGGADGNLGKIITPSAVSIQFRGNAQAKVVPMPRFLRIVTGDAKTITNGPANSRAHWTCSGTTNRFSATQYVVCPSGQLVQRVHDFAGCWNGTDLDSANHRTHVAFADSTTGACPEGFKAIPQLRITLSYQVPAGNSYAVDSFPEQLRKASTDHDDFTNVMPDRLMRLVAAMINRGVRF